MNRLCVLLIFLCTNAYALSQVPSGVWRGNSICVGKGTACHDEVAVYRIAAIPDKPDHFMVTGSKVINDKEIVMGTAEGTYKEKTGILLVPLPQGNVILHVNGNKIEGTFGLPERVLRRLTLTRDRAD